MQNIDQDEDGSCSASTLQHCVFLRFFYQFRAMSISTMHFQKIEYEYSTLPYKKSFYHESVACVFRKEFVSELIPRTFKSITHLGFHRVSRRSRSGPAVHSYCNRFAGVVEDDDVEEPYLTLLLCLWALVFLSDD